MLHLRGLGGSELSAALHPAVFRADAAAEPALEQPVLLLGLMILLSALGPSSLSVGNGGMGWVSETWGRKRMELAWLREETEISVALIQEVLLFLTQTKAWRLWKALEFKKTRIKPSISQPPLQGLYLKPGLWKCPDLGWLSYSPRNEVCCLNSCQFPSACPRKVIFFF